MSTRLIVDRLEQARQGAIARGDWNLVAELDLELLNLGSPHVETAEDPIVYETATVKRPRGRPRKTMR